VGGKTSTSTSQVQIPPEVLARYNSVNTTAQNVAQTPFQQYSTNPNAFVAPITPTQQYGIQNTNAAAGEAQPYYGAATGFALAGSQAVNPSQVDAGAINRYENPYLQQVLGATSAQINQNNQQAQAGQTGSAINQGYFGGDRSGIASAVLQGQQNLAAGQVYSGIESDAYQQALAAAQQQQGVGLEAAQANRAATQQTGQTLAELGTGAQGAALSGAQAQLGAGQVQQQTTQAGDTALYNQFLQQQSYPFQTAQFLANIAEGTGALSGNTTTSTTPGGLFSDERLKEDMEPIGKGFDGANIYRFRYKGDPTTRIGFSAQETERRHPEAVSEHGGFKAVDYGAATEDAARRGGFANAANDDFHEERRARQAGGMSGWGSYPPGVNPMSIGELLQAQAQMYGPGFGGAGLYGGSASSMPHGGSSYVPAPMQGSPMMIHGTTPPQRPQANPLHAAAQLGQDATGLQTDVHDAHQAYDWLKAPTQGQFLQNVVQNAATPDAGTVPFARGGFARAHRQDGGGFDPSDSQNDNPYQVHGGPGLNIPTADTQHPQLQTAKPPAPGGGGSGLSSLLGDASDIAGIAKAAPAIGSLASGIGTGIAGAAGGIGSTLASLLPLLALARGGRARFAAGGQPLDVGNDLAPDDPLLAGLLRDIQPPGPPEVPETPAGGPEAAAAPSAGFAGAKPPGEPAAAAEAGFAGAKPGSTLAHIYGREGTAPNPHSSAIGVGQLLDGTYMGLLREAHPDVAAQVGSDPAAIKAFRRTPQGLALSAELAPMNQNKNRAILEHQGIPVTPTNEHVMWILGAGDGPKVLHADPGTPLSGLISSAAIHANPSIMAGKTVGDFLGWARKGMNKGGFAGARHGYATDGLVVDPDAIDPTGGQADQLPAAPQVDQALVERAKQAAADPVVRQAAVANREAAAQGDPSAPPAAQAAVARGSEVTAPPVAVSRSAPAPTPPADPGPAGDIMSGAPVHDQGFLPADQSGGGGAPAKPADYLTAQAQNNLASQNRLGDMTYAQTGQGQQPQGGSFLQRAGHWLTQPEHLIPLAEGFAGMLAAPTKYPLVALSQGFSQGMQGYQQQRAYDLAAAQRQAEIAAVGTNAGAGVTNAQTGRINALVPFMSQILAPGGQFDQQLPDAGYNDPKTQQRMYHDYRPGHAANAPDITETQRNSLKQQLLVAGVSGIQSGDVSGLINQNQSIMSQGLGDGGAGGGTRGGTAQDVPGVRGTAPGGGGPTASSGGDGLPAGGQPGPSGSAGGSGDRTDPGGARLPDSGAPGAVAKHPATLEDRYAAGMYSGPESTVSDPDMSNFPNNSNVKWLTDQANLQDNRYGKGSGDSYRAQAAALQAGGPGYARLQDNNGQMQPNPWIGVNQQRQAQDAQAGANLTRTKQIVDSANAWREQSGIQQQLFRQIDESNAKVAGGGLAHKMSGAINDLSSLPFVWVPKEWKDYNEAVVEGDKVTAGARLQGVLGGNTRHAPPAGSIETTQHAMPGMDAPPGARYSYWHAQRVAFDRNAAYQDAIAAHPNVTNWKAFDHDWAQTNPPDRFFDQATGEMAAGIRAAGGQSGFYAGMTPGDVGRYVRRNVSDDEVAGLPPGTKYTWRGKGYTKPGQ
jgi:hypothetical protein